MNITSGWTIAVIAVAALVQPATPRAQFDCAITKVVITNTPESSTSVRLKVQLNFCASYGSIRRGSVDIATIFVTSSIASMVL
jgi:hypothetical protein